MKNLLPVAVFLTGLVITTPGLSHSRNDVALIREARARSNAAIQSHDVRGIVAELDSAYHMTVGSGSSIEDRDAMGDGFRRRFEEFPDAIYVRSADIVKVAESGLLSFASGQWRGSWTTPDGPLRTGGNYAASWSKASGTWKIRSELFVTLFCKGGGCP